MWVVFLLPWEVRVDVSAAGSWRHRWGQPGGRSEAARLVGDTWKAPLCFLPGLLGQAPEGHSEVGRAGARGRALRS